MFIIQSSPYITVVVVVVIEVWLIYSVVLASGSDVQQSDPIHIYVYVCINYICNLLLFSG